MSIVKDLEKLLSEEQTCLLTGNYAGLEALVDRKTKLSQMLADRKPSLPSEIYKELSSKAAHNEALLNAARRGLKAAILQLKQLSDGEAQKTYSKEGERTSLSRKRVSTIQKL